MNESDTRRKKIDPKLKEAGWEVIPESEIFTEQSAYEIAPGRIANHERNPKKIDYLLVYKGIKIAIVEAKKDEVDVSEGVAQAKEYAKRMSIRFTYSCNGDKIWAIDMKTGKEGLVNAFPSPDELWAIQFPVNNPLRDKLNAVPFNRDGGKSPRYYQENAVNAVMDAFSRKQDRVLLTLATGTGKTYIAFQICWKLTQARWNVSGTSRQPRILFLSDRNILSNQALNDFGQFPEDAMCRITPENIRKTKGDVSTSRSIYFSIFQTFMTEHKGKALFKAYPEDFFDLVIIDECHRGAANDESRWRGILEYFQKAYHLGLTATPKRKENANTYKYFGKPVYEYSLKQGIEDGFLTPYRVRISKSNIDTYAYDEDDDVESGEVDPNRIYNENDFYQGNIEIRARDEHRVKEFLDQIDPDEKTIVFGATQAHAAILRDLINQNSKKPNVDYCKRVTSDDGDKGEKDLRAFQDNEKLLPTILTTSQKLSTGVDAKNVRNIVLMRPVNNIIEFKQIIGRGTRLFDGKYFFTVYDFVGASKNFTDPDWDGDPICEKCGNFPCTCGRRGGGNKPPVKSKPCKVCGNLPCTCPVQDQKKKKVVIELSPGHKIQLATEWTERFMFDGELITIEQFIKILFGKIPSFFKNEKDLRTKWSDPKTREELLQRLADGGFSRERLRQVQTLTANEKCDLLDVLEYIAYQSTPMERAARVQLMHDSIIQELTDKQISFVEFVLKQYVENGVDSLALKQLPELVKLQYGTVKDACNKMNVDAKTLNRIFVDFQKVLYA